MGFVSTVYLTRIGNALCYNHPLLALSKAFLAPQRDFQRLSWHSKDFQYLPKQAGGDKFKSDFNLLASAIWLKLEGYVSAS